MRHSNFVVYYGGIIQDLNCSDLSVSSHRVLRRRWRGWLTQSWLRSTLLANRDLLNLHRLVACGFIFVTSLNVKILEGSSLEGVGDWTRRFAALSTCLRAVPSRSADRTALDRVHRVLSGDFLRVQFVLEPSHNILPLNSFNFIGHV